MNDHGARMLAVALATVARGWHVLPLRPDCKKPPAFHGDTTQRPCPRTGLCLQGHQTWEQRAMVDPDQVRWYWTSRRYSGCNVGIATGPSGLVVIDMDTPKSPEDAPPAGWTREGIRDGHDVFTAVCEQHNQPVPWDTFTVSTARRGTHLYFQAPDGAQLRNTEGLLGWKVDTRGWGGYVVAAGSTTPDGEYELIGDTAPARLPGWLVQPLTPRPRTAASAPSQIVSARLPAYVAAAVKAECSKVLAAQPNRHTNTLLTSAIALGQLVGAGALPPGAAALALNQAADHMVSGQCHCTDREIRRTIDNGLRLGQSEPRALPTTPAATTGVLFGSAGAA